ncbi:MAG: hypothetical protein RIC95_09485 [Vicingaceae bacterium]
MKNILSNAKTRLILVVSLIIPIIFLSYNSTKRQKGNIAEETIRCVAVFDFETLLQTKRMAFSNLEKLQGEELEKNNLKEKVKFYDFFTDYHNCLCELNENFGSQLHDEVTANLIQKEAKVHIEKVMIELDLDEETDESFQKTLKLKEQEYPDAIEAMLEKGKLEKACEIAHKTQEKLKILEKQLSAID